MSIYGTIYKSTSGLLTYSKGLDVISNNVANMNTPGFKRSDLLFRDLFYQYQMTGSNQGYAGNSGGNGVTEQGTTTSFSQGDIQQTGNANDVAIDGNGFFILRDDGNISYTRVGQFKIDQQGYLVSSTNGARVAGFSSGKLVDLNLAQFRVNPPKPTSQVNFVNNLSTGSTEHVIEDIAVFDTSGAKHVLKLTLTNNSATTARSWLAKVVDSEGNTITENQEIRYNTNGSPTDGFNSFSFSLASSDTTNTDIKFSFGEPGSFTGSTSFSAGSTSALAMGMQDGYGVGSQSELVFDSDGNINITYTNGQSVVAGQLALGWLNNLQDLKQVGSGVFEYTGSGSIKIGHANDGIMGEIKAKSIEISNVELSQEFTDLVIVQRGFQVSSQVLNIANEMLQQLLDTAGGKG